jgi:hypothetical protein
MMYSSNGNYPPFAGTWALKPNYAPFSANVVDIELTTTILKGRHEYGKISVKFDPIYANNMNLVWTSSNNSIVTVDRDGFVTAAAASGTAQITVRDAKSGATAVATVIVGDGTIDPGMIRSMSTAITPGGMFPEGSAVTLTASPSNGYNFLGWYRGETKISNGSDYHASITVADEAVTYEARFAKTN